VERRLQSFYNTKMEEREEKRRAQLNSRPEVFKPKIDVNSERMLRDRRGKIEDRLYDLHQRKLDAEENKSQLSLKSAKSNAS